MREVADRVYRLGAELVNWFLIEDGGRFTAVDAGNPNMYEQLPAALSTLGRSLDDIEAVVLTHAHADHLGSRQSRRGHLDVLIRRGLAVRAVPTGFH